MDVATDDQGRDHEDETMGTGGPPVEQRRVAVVALLLLGAVFMGVVMWYEASHHGRMSVYDQNVDAIRSNVSFLRKRGQCRQSVMEADPAKQHMNCMGADAKCTECPPGWGAKAATGGWGLKYCFKVFEEKKDWQSARRACLDAGADLAVDLRYGGGARTHIDELLGELFKGETAATGDRNVWIGLNNLIRPDEFRWVNNIRLYEGKGQWNGLEKDQWDVPENDMKYKKAVYHNVNHNRSYPLCAGIQCPLQGTEGCDKPTLNWRKLWCNSTQYFLCEKHALNVDGPFTDD